VAKISECRAFTRGPPAALPLAAGTHPQHSLRTRARSPRFTCARVTPAILHLHPSLPYSKSQLSRVPRSCASLPPASSLRSQPTPSLLSRMCLSTSLPSSPRPPCTSLPHPPPCRFSLHFSPTSPTGIHLSLSPPPVPVSPQPPDLPSLSERRRVVGVWPLSCLASSRAARPTSAGRACGWRGEPWSPRTRAARALAASCAVHASPPAST
jgi:hypothetical protein